MSPLSTPSPKILHHQSLGRLKPTPFAWKRRQHFLFQLSPLCGRSHWFTPLGFLWTWAKIIWRSHKGYCNFSPWCADEAITVVLTVAGWEMQWRLYLVTWDPRSNPWFPHVHETLQSLSFNSDICKKQLTKQTCQHLWNQTLPLLKVLEYQGKQCTLTIWINWTLGSLFQ